MCPSLGYAQAEWEAGKGRGESENDLSAGGSWDKGTSAYRRRDEQRGVGERLKESWGGGYRGGPIAAGSGGSARVEEERASYEATAVVQGWSHKEDAPRDDDAATSGGAGSESRKLADDEALQLTWREARDGGKDGGRGELARLKQGRICSVLSTSALGGSRGHRRQGSSSHPWTPFQRAYPPALCLQESLHGVSTFVARGSARGEGKTLQGQGSWSPIWGPTSAAIVGGKSSGGGPVLKRGASEVATMGPVVATSQGNGSPARSRARDEAHSILGRLQTCDRPSSKFEGSRTDSRRPDTSHGVPSTWGRLRGECPMEGASGSGGAWALASWKNPIWGSTCRRTMGKVGSARTPNDHSDKGRSSPSLSFRRFDTLGTKKRPGLQLTDTPATPESSSSSTISSSPSSTYRLPIPRTSATPKSLPWPPKSLGNLRSQLSLKSGKAAFHETYQVKEILGEGAFGVVRRCLHKKTGRAVACKMIAKETLSRGTDVLRVRGEFAVQKLVSGHKNIVGAEDLFEDELSMFLVMEHCPDGDLFDLLNSAPPLGEAQAKGLFTQVLHAVQRCQDHRVLHRDIKLENILVTGCKWEQASRGEDSPLLLPETGRKFRRVLDGMPVLKLGDFGSALVLAKGQKACGSAGGSPMYQAPEVLRNEEYGFKADVWSLGVLLFVLVTGRFPFTAPSEALVRGMIKRGLLSFEAAGARWKDASPEAKDLVQQMLQVDPEKRASVKEVSGHPWLQETLSVGWLKQGHYHFQQQGHDQRRRQRGGLRQRKEQEIGQGQRISRTATWHAMSFNLPMDLGV